MHRADDTLPGAESLTKETSLKVSQRQLLPSDGGGKEVGGKVVGRSYREPGYEAVDTRDEDATQSEVLTGHMRRQT